MSGKQEISPSNYTYIDVKIEAILPRVSVHNFEAKLFDGLVIFR